MADVFTKAKRSEVMSRIRNRGNRDTDRLVLHQILGCEIVPAGTGLMTGKGCREQGHFCQTNPFADEGRRQTDKFA
jgi:hypothetical protein